MRHFHFYLFFLLHPLLLLLSLALAFDSVIVSNFRSNTRLTALPNATDVDIPIHINAVIVQYYRYSIIYTVIAQYYSAAKESRGRHLIWLCSAPRKKHVY